MKLPHYSKIALFLVFGLWGFFVVQINADIPTLNLEVTENITEITPLNNTQNYTTIYQYITTKYKRITTENAHTISYELCKQTQDSSLDPLLFASIIAVESRFDHKAIGGGNASGLGQFMPGTYRHYKVKNPLDITENISGMARYIKELNQMWKQKENVTTLILVSYNRGETFARRNQHNLGPKALAYVDKVMVHYKNLEEIKAALSPDTTDDKEVSSLQ